MGGPASWSIDPNQNDTIDSDIFLAEGQPPPTLNNACRAIMAGVAKLQADTTGDNAGSGAAGGALSVTTAQGFDLTRPFEMSFTVDAVNTGPLNLVVDGSAARALQRPGNIPLGPGDLVPGILYRSLWRPAISAHILITPVPEVPGKIEMFAHEAAVPSGWVVCDGRSLNRTTYAALFSAIGTTFGAPNGTQFRVPDLRGRAPFGADAMGGTAANRLTGGGGLDGGVGSAGGVESVALSVAQMPSHTHPGTTGAGGAQAGTTTGAGGAHNHGGSTGDAGGHSHGGTTASAGDHTHTASTASAGGHSHEQRYTTLSGVQAGGGLVLMANLANGPGASYNGAGLDEPIGGHTHGVTVVAGGAHTHPFATDTVAAHSHSIPATPDHTHSIPAVAAHTHAVSLDSVGSGGAHANMPPGLVLVFAIKA